LQHQNVAFTLYHPLITGVAGTIIVPVHTAIEALSALIRRLYHFNRMRKKNYLTRQRIKFAPGNCEDPTGKKNNL